MDKNKMIIGALIVVILVLFAGIFISMSNFAKTDSQLEIISDDELNEGDVLQIKLTDVNGIALANQTVKITFTDKDNSNSEYSVVTNDEGIGELKLDKSAGDYNLTVSYDGSDGYNACGSTKKITIEEKVVESQTSTSNNDPGAFYSPQAGRVIYTGEVVDSPAGLQRHLGNNQWEPVK